MDAAKVGDVFAAKIGSTTEIAECASWLRLATDDTDATHILCMKISALLVEIWCSALCKHQLESTEFSVNVMCVKRFIPRKHVDQQYMYVLIKN